MPKFEVRLRLQGLELDIKGEREDIPRLTQGIAEQLAGVLQPTVLLRRPKSQLRQPKMATMEGTFTLRQKRNSAANPLGSAARKKATATRP
jgi:hypothetical protein